MKVKIKKKMERLDFIFFRKSICSLQVTAVDNIEYENIQPHVQICSKLL